MCSIKRYVALALAVALLCGAALPAHAYALFGSGKKYKPGEKVEISAPDRSREGLKFDHWEANTDKVVFNDPYSSNTWFIVPDSVTSIDVIPRFRELKVISPGKDFYYYDGVGVLSEELKGEICCTNKQLFKDCGAQIVVVVLSTTGKESINDYSIQLFNSWGIGDSQKNNGFLLLLAIDDDDYYACTGSGIDEALPDDEVFEILYYNLEGDFAARKYDSGVRKAYEAFFKRIASICGSDVTIQDGMDEYARSLGKLKNK